MTFLEKKWNKLSLSFKYEFLQNDVFSMFVSCPVKIVNLYQICSIYDFDIFNSQWLSDMK